MVRHDQIQISNLALSVDQRVLFANFNASIPCGARIALVGDNGSGKSTLLRCLAGQTVPSEGSIHEPDNLRIGYLPQKMALEGNKTAWEVATELVRPVLDDLQRFEDVAAHIAESPQAEHEYNHLLDRLMACNGFTIESDVEELLTRAGLLDYRASRVNELSGGQQTLLGLVRILAADPNLLLLDEPTNHLDRTNRAALLKLLNDWCGSAIVVSHNVELLRTWPTTIWDIANGTVTIFDGRYDDFVREKELRQEQLVEQVETLRKERRKLSKSMEEEQQRTAQSRREGKKKYASAPKIVRGAKKRQAEATTGKLKGSIAKRQEEVAEQLKQVHLPKKITPRFDMPTPPRGKPSIQIRDGNVSYGDILIVDPPSLRYVVVVEDINLLVTAGERIVLMGDNGSGKSTLVKGIMANPAVTRTGEWLCPPPEQIGYLDQHYSALKPDMTAFATIREARPALNEQETRTFLNDFLFRTNEEVSTPVHALSGGESARLALAQIAAQSPMLLILDEMTNNLDLTTRQHVIEVLQAYPGTIIAISHDNDFLEQIGVSHGYEIKAHHIAPTELPWL